MAQENPTGLLVSFYIGKDGKDFVKILNVVDNSEYHALATSSSHRDINTNEEVSYAERFAPQYAAYLAGKSKSVAKEIEEAESRLAALKAAQGEGETSPKAIEAAAEKAREAAAADRADKAARTDRIAAANAAAETAAAVAKGIVDATKAKVQETDGPNFDAMTDDDLRDFIAAGAGKAPAASVKRDDLVKMAKEV